MRKLIVLILWVFSSIALFGQTTAVTATITDSDSTVWINPQWSVQFVPNPNFPQLSSYSIGGVPITSNTYSQYIQVSGTGNGSGVISTTLLDNNQILPVGSKYRWVVQSQTSAAATTYLPVTVTSASQSLTSYLSSNAVTPRFSAAAPGAFGYADVEISVVPQPGGLYYNTVAANQRIWNGTAWGNNGGNSGGSAIIYLSCAIELGTQINTAVTTLNNTGLIQLPNCTNATMTTTATNLPPGISLKGYGKLATIITCSVAGDCIQSLNNPTTNGEIGAVFSDFAMNPSGASGQVLMHLKGASGYTLHDLQFAPYATGPAAATCLEFDNSAPGIFTERVRTYNVYIERTCTIGVLFNVVASADPSFAYDTFEFGVVSAGANYAIVFNGAGRMYGGSLSVTANHVGPGGGILQYNNDFGSAGLSNAAPGEHIFITAEENGTGAGTLLAATGTNVLLLDGTIFNGSSSANALATKYAIGGSALFQLSNGPIYTDNTTGIPYVKGEFDIQPNGSTDGKLKLIPFGSLTPTYSVESSNGGNIVEFTQSGPGAGASTIPFLFYGAPFAALSSQVGPQVPDAGCYQWGSGTTFVVDTMFCRSAAGVVSMGIPGSQAPLPVTGTPTVGRASCIKSAGPPVVIGFCSTIVDASGACTCN